MHRSYFKTVAWIGKLKQLSWPFEKIGKKEESRRRDTWAERREGDTEEVRFQTLQQVVESA